MPAIQVSDYIRANASKGLFEAIDAPTDSRDSGERPLARAQQRAARWQSDLARGFAYASQRARNDAERAALERAYEATLSEGPDFTRYHGGSDFIAPPKISMDRNALARLRFKLHGLFKGSWGTKAKGKHCGVIQRTTLDVFDALLSLAKKYGEVYPSLDGLAHLSQCCKNTVIAALKELERFGFIVKHRRIKRVQTDFGVKVVQDSNAYDLTDPMNGFGALAMRIFCGETSAAGSRSPSESNKWAAMNPSSSNQEGYGQKSRPDRSPDGAWAGLRAAWECS
jgi:hypothetical protein